MGTLKVLKVSVMGPLCSDYSHTYSVKSAFFEDLWEDSKSIGYSIVACLNSLSSGAKATLRSNKAGAHWRKANQGLIFISLSQFFEGSWILYNVIKLHLLNLLSTDILLCKFCLQCVIKSQICETNFENKIKIWCKRRVCPLCNNWFEGTPSRIAFFLCKI